MRDYKMKMTCRKTQREENKETHKKLQERDSNDMNNGQYTGESDHVGAPQQ